MRRELSVLGHAVAARPAGGIRRPRRGAARRRRHGRRRAAGRAGRRRRGEEPGRRRRGWSAVAGAAGAAGRRAPRRLGVHSARHLRRTRAALVVHARQSARLRRGNCNPSPRRRIAMSVPVASRSQRVSLIVLPFCLPVWMSVGHSATYILPRLIDHNQIWSSGIYLSSDP